MLQKIDARILDRYLKREVQQALQTGGLVAAGLGIICSSLLALGMAAGLVEGLTYPAVFSFCAGTYALGLSFAASRGLLPGPLTIPLLIPFVSLPTIFFLGAHVIYPSGAATFITGPMSYLYFVVIVVSGLLFNRRLSELAGLLAFAGYMGVYWLSIPGLSTISAPDALMLQDLQAAPIYFFRGVMMLFAGLIVGGWSAFVKRLIIRILREETERSAISRLFGEYVSDEIREKIIQEKGQLVAERVTAAVLFCDIRDFSTFSESRPPEAVLGQLNTYFEGMVDAISRTGGVVDKFIGDAIMAVFGGVLSHDAPADAAFDAAVAMRAALVELNQRWQVQGLPEFENGIGIHVGEVVQGPLGSASRKEFTVIGDGVNVAARVEGLCKEKKVPILLTRETWLALTPNRQSSCQSLGEVKVKGRRQFVELFSVSGTP